MIKGANIPVDSRLLFLIHRIFKLPTEQIKQFNPKLNPCQQLSSIKLGVISIHRNGSSRIPNARRQCPS